MEKKEYTEEDLQRYDEIMAELEIKIEDRRAEHMMTEEVNKQVQESLAKAKEYFAKRIARNDPEFAEDVMPTGFVVTNNVHDYAMHITDNINESSKAIRNIEGVSDYGEINPDKEEGWVEKGTLTPDFKMDEKNMSFLEFANGGKSTVVIYIPDPEKGEKGSYKEKYDEAFFDLDEDVMYMDNVVEREPQVIIPKEKDEFEKDLIESGAVKTISVDRLEEITKDTDPRDVNNFLKQAIYEINNPDKEI